VNRINEYFIDNAVATAPDFFGDFVVVGSEVTEICLDFVVLVSLGNLRLFGVCLLIGHFKLWEIYNYFLYLSIISENYFLPTLTEFIYNQMPHSHQR
jgi:hypothetical protein